MASSSEVSWPARKTALCPLPRESRALAEQSAGSFRAPARGPSSTRIHRLRGGRARRRVFPRSATQARRPCGLAVATVRIRVWLRSPRPLSAAQCAGARFQLSGAHDATRRRASIRMRVPRAGLVGTSSGQLCASSRASVNNTGRVASEISTQPYNDTHRQPAPPEASSASISSNTNSLSWPPANRRAAGLSNNRNSTFDFRRQCRNTGLLRGALRTCKRRTGLLRAEPPHGDSGDNQFVPSPGGRWQHRGSSSVSFCSASSTRPIRRRRRIWMYRAWAAFSRSPWASSIARRPRSIP